MKFKKALFPALGLALAISMAACSSGTTAPSASTSASGPESAAKTKSVVFSFGQSVHPFFVAMEKGARDYATKAGINFSTTSADYKVENQVQNVEDTLQKNVDGILLNPIDSAALANSVQMANDKNVPVITVDINVVGATTTSFVASDNKSIGKQAADFIAKSIGESGDVALIGAPQVTSTNAREEGFKEALKAYPNIKLVANSGEAMQRASALAAAETILEANPNLKAVFGVNESGALGAMSAIQARNKNILVVAVDATPDVLDAIKNDTPVKATIAQDPYQMGYIAMQLMEKKLNGETIESSVSAPIDLVTKDNVQTFIDREAKYAAK